MNSERLPRRGFLQHLALFSAATVVGAFALTGCAADVDADDDDLDDDESGADEVGTNEAELKSCGATIATNHGHELVLSAKDVAGTKAKTFAIKGSSSHDHTVKLTAANLKKLRAGKSLRKASATTLGHSHVVTIRCS